MPKLRRSIYPFELNLLQGLAARVREHGFAKSHYALLDTGHRAFQKHKVVLDLAVADETTHAELLLVLLGRNTLGLLTG